MRVSVVVVVDVLRVVAVLDSGLSPCSIAAVGRCRKRVEAAIRRGSAVLPARDGGTEAIVTVASLEHVRYVASRSSGHVC